MGEAKRRKASDPTFGRIPRRGRGLIVSPPIEVEGSHLLIKSSVLDPQELRCVLLFWDRMAWPASHALRLLSGPDEQFLEQAGIMSRPLYHFTGDFAQIIAQTQIQAFLDLEQHEPGLWALAQGENSLLLKNQLLEEGRGALVELTRAIPVPDKDVPLNDILEFRLKRRDDLLRLRHEIDSFFTAVSDAADKQFELRRRIEQIGTVCADILRIAKESAFPFRLSDFRASFEIQPISAIAAFVGWQFGIAHEMPIVSAAVAGAAASFKIKKDFGVHGIKLRSSPYRYVYQFHNEVF